MKLSAAFIRSHLIYYSHLLPNCLHPTTIIFCLRFFFFPSAVLNYFGVLLRWKRYAKNLPEKEAFLIAWNEEGLTHVLCSSIKPVTDKFRKKYLTGVKIICNERISSLSALIFPASSIKFTGSIINFSRLLHGLLYNCYHWCGISSPSSLSSADCSVSSWGAIQNLIIMVTGRKIGRGKVVTLHTIVFSILLV